MKKEKRRYSGQSFENRQAERREKLVRAALNVAGRAGIDGLSVAAICAEAGLTARYFYESFPSREAIFVEAYRAAQDELLARIAQSRGTHEPAKSARDRRDPAKSALTAFFAGLQGNPGLARVFLVDIDDHSGAMRIASFEGAKKLAKAFALKSDHPLMIAGIIGGIVDIAKRWIESEFSEPVEKVVEIALPFTKLG